MKVCGIVGSPIKNGNVDILVSQALAGASDVGAETQKFYLNEISIRPCQSCGTDPFPSFCLFRDDMDEVYEALKTSDVVVLGSPIYFDTVTAQTKLLIDRCNCLMPYILKEDGSYGFVRRMEKRKKGVLIVVSGVDQETETIQKTVAGFFLWANIEWSATIVYAHDDDGLGSVGENEAKMREAFEIGTRIAQLPPD